MPLGISTKCLQISPSATLALDAKVKEMRSQGVDVIGFAAGEPDFDTPLPIRNAMKMALDEGATRYTPVAGTIALREAISHRILADYGIKYNLNEIIVSNGAKHSLYNVFQTILNPEDEVIIPTPCWVSYPEMVKMAGGVTVFVEGTEEDDFVPCLDKIKQAITPKTKAFILTNPSNPNGNIWNIEQLQALGALAVEHNFYIISDEIYDKLVYDNIKHNCIATLSDAIKERTLLVNGVSKTYAMTGFRIGYTAGPKDIISAMTNYQSQATSAPNTPAQHAATIALTMPQDSITEMRDAFESRRDKLVSLINGIDGLHCRTPKGAFYVMMNISDLFGKTCDNKLIENSNDFANCLLEKAHVAVVPGRAFLAEDYCRLSYATSMQNIEEGLARISRFVKELN